MTSVLLDCPHCRARDVLLGIAAQAEVTPPAGVGRRLLALMICPACKSATVGVFDSRSPGEGTGVPQLAVNDPAALGFAMSDHYPRAAAAGSIRIPGEVTRYLQQAARAHVDRCYDASATMSRRAVGLAAAQLLAEEAGKYPTVLSRVLELAARRRIAPEIADWAHHLQLEESAACDASNPCTGATAQGLLDFSDMFLMCAYTLPEQIAERRRRVDALVAQPAIT